ncbi:hypothetical protein KW830_02715 [Comamonas sp. CMM03]|uniref:hypothetical protein n=1 Tax=Comamonas sp. CMM03 TaxID=2854781 RepID=UPI001C4379A1|nr:hypothetical protein [Comamonas sp. CMM03]MBV7417360.1 hypothetical protein [Comamonas sp. CMM03]
MDGAIIYLFVAVLAAFSLSFLFVFHMPEGRWMDSIGLVFGGLGSMGLFYLFVLINEGPRTQDVERAARPPQISLGVESSRVLR